MVIVPVLQVERQAYAHDILRVLERSLRDFRRLTFDPSKPTYIEGYFHINYDKVISSLLDDCSQAGVEQEARDLMRTYGYNPKIPIPVLEREKLRDSSLESLHGLLQGYAKSKQEIQRYPKASRIVKRSIFAAYIDCLDVGVTMEELREIGDSYDFSFTGSEKRSLPLVALAA